VSVASAASSEFGVLIAYKYESRRALALRLSWRHELVTWRPSHSDYIHPNFVPLSRSPLDVRAIPTVALRERPALPVALKKQLHTARRAPGRAAIGDERPLVGAVHGAALVMPGKPGHDM